MAVVAMRRPNHDPSRQDFLTLLPPFISIQPLLQEAPVLLLEPKRQQHQQPQRSQTLAQSVEAMSASSAQRATGIARLARSLLLTRVASVTQLLSVSTRLTMLVSPPTTMLWMRLRKPSKFGRTSPHLEKN
jgi:hypothetical protein